MKKYLPILTLAFFLLFSNLCMASTVTLQEDNITLNANSFAHTSFDIQVGSNEVVAMKSLSDIGNATIITEEDEFESNSTANIYFLAYKGYKPKNRTARFNFTTNSKTVNTESNSFDDSSGDWPYIELSQVPDQGTVECEYNGSDVDCSPTGLGGKIYKVNDNVSSVVVAYNYTTGNISSVQKTVNILKGRVIPEELKALIEVRSTGPYTRDGFITVKLIDNMEHEALTGCTVSFLAGEYEESFKMYSSPVKNLHIPEDLKSNSFTVAVTSCQDGDVETGYSITKSITSWDEYYSKNKLVLKNLKSDGNKISGKVVNKNGVGVSDKIKIGGDFSKKIGSPSFSISVSESGDYKLKAVRTDSDSSMFDSEVKNVTVTIDSDGDGVVDKNDLCGDTEEGANVNENGCTPEEIKLEIWKDGEGVEEPLVKGNEYTLRFVGENGSLHNMTGAIVFDGGRDVKIEHGTALFNPEEKKVYRIHKNATNQYEEIDESITVEGGFLSGISWLWVGIIVVIIIVVIMVVRILVGRSGGGRESGPEVGTTGFARSESSSAGTRVKKAKKE